jgi:hypothetical protein
MRSDEFLGALPRAAPPPRVAVHLARAGEVLGEHLLQLRDQARIAEAEVGFFVEREGPVVEVGGADGRPRVVDHHEFVVEHRGLVLADLDARVHQLPVEAGAVLPRPPGVAVAAGDDQLHPRAAVRRLPDQFDHRGRGDEVGVRDLNGAPRRLQREQVHGGRRARALLGRAQDRLDRHVAERLRHGEEVRPREQFAGGDEPVLREAGLLRQRRRPFDARHHVPPFGGMARLVEPVIGDAGAAGEGDAAVDDDRLAVGAVVRAPDGVPADGAVPGQFAAARLQHAEDLLADGRRADRIHEQLDGNARARFLREGFGKAASHVRIPPDVLLHRHRALRALNRFDHRGIEFVAVHQQIHPVPRLIGGCRHAAQRYGKFWRIHVETRLHGIDERMGARRRVIERESQHRSPRRCHPPSQHQEQRQQSQPQHPGPEYPPRVVPRTGGADRLRLETRRSQPV